MKHIQWETIEDLPNDPVAERKEQLCRNFTRANQTDPSSHPYSTIVFKALLGPKPLICNNSWRVLKCPFLGGWAFFFWMGGTFHESIQIFWWAGDLVTNAKYRKTNMKAFKMDAFVRVSFFQGTCSVSSNVFQHKHSPSQKGHTTKTWENVLMKSPASLRGISRYSCARTDTKNVQILTTNEYWGPHWATLGRVSCHQMSLESLQLYGCACEVFGPCDSKILKRTH